MFKRLFTYQKELLVAILTLTVVLVVYFCFRTSAIDKYIQDETKAGYFSGAVLVAKNDRIVLSKGYGMANYELDVPNTPQTKFRLGSITKQFTSMAIVMLQEKGLLSVQDKLSKFIPDYPHGDEITIHELLIHASGIPNFTSFPDYNEFAFHATTLEKTIARFKNLPLDFKPGEKHAYSNSNYILLSFIIEKIAGTTYEQFIDQNIFKPLGMHNSGYDHNQTIIKNRASGYRREGGVLYNASYVDMSTPSGAGGLYSTIEDLYLWSQALNNEKLVTKQSLDKIFEAYIPMNSSGESDDSYCYGWCKYKSCDRTIIGHNGGINGFSTNIERFVEDGVVIIILSNFEHGQKITKIIRKIIFDLPLKFQKNAKQIDVDPKIYDDYVGEYFVKDTDFFLSIVKEDNKLFMFNPYEPKAVMLPKSETEFFFDDKPLILSFTKNEKGNVIEMVGIERDESEQRFIKKNVKN